MKEISMRTDDDLHRRSSRKVGDSEALKSGDDAIDAARSHQSELFSAIRNFGVGVMATRE